MRCLTENESELEREFTLLLWQTGKNYYKPQKDYSGFGICPFVVQSNPDAREFDLNPPVSKECLASIFAVQKLRHYHQEPPYNPQAGAFQRITYSQQSATTEKEGGSIFRGRRESSPIAPAVFLLLARPYEKDVFGAGKALLATFRKKASTIVLPTISQHFSISYNQTDHLQLSPVNQ